MSGLSSENIHSSRGWLAAALLALLTFAAIAPTLRWPQFTGGNENIVAATALEMRQGGPWVVPRLNGEPRVKKPPLVAWITAATLSEQTLQKIQSPDVDTRRAAYQDLAWQVRWTGLLAGSITMLATYAMARSIGGPALGIAATLIVAANLLFMKYMRQSTSDVHLAMWVTIANACFVHGIVQRRWGLAATLGSLATAMAVLCKGPVALLETVLPFIVSLALVRPPETPAPPPAGRPLRSAGWMALGLLIFGAVALPWFVHVWQNVPGVWNTWFTEVTREGATDLEASSPAKYLQLFGMMWPWLVFGVIGWIAIFRGWRADRRLLIPVLQVLLPLLVMVWFRDRKERYMLPLVAPSAILCAIGLLAWMSDWRRRPDRWLGREQIILVSHAILLLGGAIGLAWVGVAQKSLDGGPWWPVSVAAVLSLLSLAIVGMAIHLQRRHTWALAGGTFAILLLLQAVFMQGYRRSAAGVSAFAPLADTIRRTAPDAPVYDWAGPTRRVQEEISIYLGRPIRQAEPDTLHPGEQPTVLLIRQDRGEPAPTLPPPWQVISSATEKKQTWWAFLLPPAGPGPLPALNNIP